MDVKGVIQMKGGDDENSYANNSTVQNDILLMTMSHTEQALVDLLQANLKTMTRGKMGIADLGCSSGPNAFATVSHVLDVVHAALRRQCRRSPELLVFLNDLPANDFNILFVSLPSFFSKLRQEKGEEFGPCFVFGAPGSLHGRLFPSDSLHFVHSSSALHWLSQIPPGLNPTSKPPLNKGKICISNRSTNETLDAYRNQFRDDMYSFLKSRSQEAVIGGKMVLSLMGRTCIDPTLEEDLYLQWDLLANSLTTMVSELN